MAALNAFRVRRSGAFLRAALVSASLLVPAWSWAEEVPSDGTSTPSESSDPNLLSEFGLIDYLVQSLCAADGDESPDVNNGAVGP